MLFGENYFYASADNPTSLSSIVLPTTTEDITIVYAQLITNDNDCHLYWGAATTTNQNVLDSEGSTNQLQSFNQIYLPAGTQLSLDKSVANKRCNASITYTTGNLSSSTVAVSSSTTYLQKVSLDTGFLIVIALIVLVISILDFIRRIFMKQKSY